MDSLSDKVAVQKYFDRIYKMNTILKPERDWVILLIM